VDWESTLGDLLQGECEGEYFVMNPSGGAIAYFGSTGVAWCPDRGEDGEIYAPYYLMGDMDRQVYLAFYENHNRLGDMWGNALINYLKQPYYHQLNYYVNETEAKGYLNEKTVMEFILLGDPTLRIYNKPQTLDVPEDYATIQSAINDAYSGDAIRIAPGEYHENLIINKGVSLFGEDMEKTILDSFGVHVTAHDATISNLTIRNNNYGCITLSNAYDCNISRTILENSYMGIYLSNSSSNRLAGNILTNCSYGIFLDHGSRFNDVLVNTISDSGEGIYLFNECSDNTVWLNSIVGSHGYGIWIGNYSSDNWILNNSLTNTKNTAIFLLRALSNFVFANSISYSSYGGILLRDFCANNIIANNTASKNELGIMIDSSFDNEIYHNNFIDNVQQALIHPNGSLKNTWDNGYPSGGNYWSDHSGNDVYSGIFQNETGRDGIYDAPYVVRDNNRDNYPLAKPYYGPVRNLDDGQNYRSIQMAIDHASKRDRILVLSGTYHENIFVNKPVTLIGEGRNNTAIWGSGYRPAIDVISDETVISGFTIRGGWDGNGILLNGTNACSITNNLINYSHIGIWFVNSSRDRFTGNILTGCTYGILMGNNSCNNIILDNEISWNTDGIQLVGPSSGNNISYNLIHGNRDYGICLSNATGNGIVGNDLSEAGEVGVYLIGSSSNTLKGNTIVDCGLPGSHASGGGMFLNDSCDNNTITINIIANNAEYGIMLRLSSDNKISHNDFINNTEHAVVTREGFTKNSWDSGYPSGGNFWSGHNPPGKNKDKIGEIPYVIDENNTDNYPLIYPSKCYDPHYTSSPDINKDGKVDIRDVFVIAMAFGSTPGDPNWNPIADLNNDGTVNILDVFAVAWDFGKTV
jgi:parallel beta-helix repeat protein